MDRIYVSSMLNPFHSFRFSMHDSKVYIFALQYASVQFHNMYVNLKSAERNENKIKNVQFLCLQVIFRKYPINLHVVDMN